MQIQLDPKQMEYLRRQAEAMERIAHEMSKIRKVSVDVFDVLTELNERQKAKDPD